MKTKEELKKQKAEWFQKNKQAIYERRKEYLRQWREKNREKWNAYGAEWYANNKDKRKRSMREWEYNHSAERKAYNKKWKDANKEKLAEQQRIRLLGYKTLIVEAYGGGCTCCGEKRISMLTVEHTNKNGKQHRQVGGNFYYYLVRKNFPKDEGLTILCMNCNWSERNGFPCEHKLEKSASTSAATVTVAAES